MTGNASTGTGNLAVLIGGSAGGLPGIISICRRLPADFDGIVVVALHRVPNSNRDHLQALIDHCSPMQTTRIFDGDVLSCATIHVNRPTDSAEIEEGRFQSVHDLTMKGRIRRIDDLFLSAAKEFGEHTVGVILSGMLDDGIEGLKAIKEAGGWCFVQSPEYAQFPSMPTEALERVDIDFDGTPEEIADRIKRISANYKCRIAKSIHEAQVEVPHHAH